VLPSRFLLEIDFSLSFVKLKEYLQILFLSLRGGLPPFLRKILEDPLADGWLFVTDRETFAPSEIHLFSPPVKLHSLAPAEEFTPPSAEGASLRGASLLPNRHLLPWLKASSP